MIVIDILREFILIVNIFGLVGASQPGEMPQKSTGRRKTCLKDSRSRLIP